jgi:hypothetical protein
MTVAAYGGQSREGFQEGAQVWPTSGLFLVRPPRLRKAEVSGLVFLLAASMVARAQSPSEYQVKAVFLYYFAKFVEWPPDASANTRAPIVLGIFDEGPFGSMLEETISGKTVNGRALVIRRFKWEEDAKGCHIVFIGSSGRKHLRSILAKLKAAGVLTVGETEGFTQMGGVISFFLEDNKVHFEVNVDAAERARLKISSKLLLVAKVVRDEQ